MLKKNTMLMKEMKKDLKKWRHVMFMDWKTKQSKDVSPPQIDLQVECNSCQNTSKLCCRYTPNYLKFYMERQKELE